MFRSEYVKVHLSLHSHLFSPIYPLLSLFSHLSPLLSSLFSHLSPLFAPQQCIEIIVYSYALSSGALSDSKLPSRSRWPLKLGDAYDYDNFGNVATPSVAVIFF